MAASAGQDETVELLQEFAATVHDATNFALGLAVACGQRKVVEVLLQAGTDWRELKGQLGTPGLRDIFSRHTAEATSEVL